MENGKNIYILVNHGQAKTSSSFLTAMYLIAGKFGSNTLIFIWIRQEKIARLMSKKRGNIKTFIFDSDDEMKLAPVLHKFLEYCNLRKNITILRHMFCTYKLQESQNFHIFLTKLKKVSSECEFDNLQDSLIKDVIVCGTWGNSFRDRLLRE